MDDGGRVHIEDFAQIVGAQPEQKYLRAGYAEIAEVLGREVGDDAVAEFVRRLVFCALIGNGDAHLKNWSVIYPDARTPQLAPAYGLGVDHRLRGRRPHGAGMGRRRAPVR